ncbi:MFS transporter [Saccharomonospora sp. NPDC046836]|uniref:MFS transporter n=1 Tax=Saccharomonospora sp. NPDC046836 TaxID=3156921 RepID=UPI0033D1066A
MVDRDFGGLFWGKVTSNVSVWVHGVVAAIVVFDATGSALAVSLVSAVQFLPQVLLSPLSGILADKGHAAIQLLVGRLLCTIGTGGLAVWWSIGPELDGWDAAASVLFFSGIVGLGFVTGGAAMQSVVPSMVTTEELPTAMTLNTAPLSIGRVVGPVIGAIGFTQLGAAPSFMLAALGHFIFVLLLVFCIRVPSAPPETHGDLSMLAAVQFVRKERTVLRLLVAVAALGMASEPLLTLAPAVASRLGSGPGVVGVLAAGFGAGAMLGMIATAVARRWLHEDRVTGLGLAAMILGIVAGSSVVPSEGLVTVGFTVAGVGFTMAMASAGSLIQQRVPAPFRGRVMAMWMMGFVGSRPASAALTGAVSDAWSVDLAMGAVAVTLLVIAAYCRPRQLRREN